MLPWPGKISGSLRWRKPPTHILQETAGRHQLDVEVSTMSYRIVRDPLGEVRVPQEAYYGAQTQRARENFPISGLRLPRAFIRAQGIIKASAAYANGQV